MAVDLKLISEEEHTPKGLRRIEEICRLATRVFSEKGYWAATMTDLAKATGVSKGGLYHYFQTKEQLLYQILHNFIDKMLEGLAEEVARIEPPQDRIVFLVRRHIELYAHDVYGARLMFHNMHLLPPNLFEIMIKKSREYRHIWTDAVRPLYPEPAAAANEISTAALSLLGMCNWVYLWYDPSGRISTDSLIQYICDMFFGRFGQRLNLAI